MPHRDLATEAYLALRTLFFDASGIPVPYFLRPKENVQDDPFDELVVKRLSQHFVAHEVDIGVIRSPGPLISPDLLIYRPSLMTPLGYASSPTDPTALLAIEVKKLERTSTGKVARASGMDYNTTPPCGTVRIYSADGSSVDVRSAYLFVCQESHESDRHFALSALTLCDGNALNDDFELYLSIVGRRFKQIGLGTYGDGVNRVRPMLIFGNPLGCTLFDRCAMLIHERPDLATAFTTLKMAGTFTRSPKQPTAEDRTFYCYRDRRDVADAELFQLDDPFPTPVRSTTTQRRGRFQLPWPITQGGSVSE